MYGTPTPQAITATGYTFRTKKNLRWLIKMFKINIWDIVSINKMSSMTSAPMEHHLGREIRVYLLCVAVPQGHSKKFHNPWKEPFQIITTRLLNKIYDDEHKEC